jgi:uncharacterized protein (TIGR03437 family)
MIGSQLRAFRWLLAGAVASVPLCGCLRAQAPDYTSNGIVNSSDFSPGPFAPGSVLSLFGSNLAWTTEAVTPGELAAGSLPTQLAAIRVYVDNVPVPLLYASPTQINFLVPTEQIPGDVSVTVVRQGEHGPSVTITLVGAAPALFVMAGGSAIAQDWNAGYTLLTTATPAHAGDVVVLYSTGLGHTNPPWASGEVAQSAANIAALASLRVLINGVAIDAPQILYAGVTPGFSGLYQINFRLPANTGTNPEIRVQVGLQTSIPNVTLAVE